MVGPISAAERSAFTRKIQVAVVLLVAVSTTLVAVQVDATGPQVAGALVVGLVVGALVAWYVVPDNPVPADRQAARRERPDNPFADGGRDGDAGPDAEGGRSSERSREK